MKNSKKMDLQREVTVDFLEMVAEDMHLSDNLVSADDYLKVINRSKKWIYEWGVILADGNEMHLHVLSTYRKRVFLRKPLREVFLYIFDIYPVIYTRILKKESVLDFDLRMGWRKVNESEHLIHLEMKKEDFVYG